MADALLRFILNGNKKTTHTYAYQKETVSYIKDTKEITEGNSPTNFKLIKQYQRKYLILMAKYQEGTHHKGYFPGKSNIYLNFITCEDKIFIPSIIKSYVLHWYYMYILHPGMFQMEVMI